MDLYEDFDLDYDNAEPCLIYQDKGEYVYDGPNWPGLFEAVQQYVGKPIRGC